MSIGFFFGTAEDHVRRFHRPPNRCKITNCTAVHEFSCPDAVTLSEQNCSLLVRYKNLTLYFNSSSPRGCAPSLHMSFSSQPLCWKQRNSSASAGQICGLRRTEEGVRVLEEEIRLQIDWVLSCEPPWLPSRVFFLQQLQCFSSVRTLPVTGLGRQDTHPSQAQFTPIFPCKTCCYNKLLPVWTDELLSRAGTLVCDGCFR